MEEEKSKIDEMNKSVFIMIEKVRKLNAEQIIFVGIYQQLLTLSNM